MPRSSKDSACRYCFFAAAQVRAGEFRPRDASAQARALSYLDELEARGRYTLMVWPVHCEIGTLSHAHCRSF